MSEVNEQGRIAFIGAGRIATALAKALIRKGMKKDSLSAYDVSEGASAKFAENTGVKVSKSSEECLSAADVVILAVKPQNIAESLTETGKNLRGRLLVSVAAGVKIETIHRLGGCGRIVRVMPNTPALIGEGISVYSFSPDVTKEDVRTVERIFSAVGQVCCVEETMMDAVTGLSGSGPAFVFDFIQALTDGGIKSGLPEDLALKLAVQTVKGAACLARETGEKPSVLRDQVTSPGGTTARGLSVLGKNSFSRVVSEAVIAAAERSKELGEKK